MKVIEYTGRSRTGKKSIKNEDSFCLPEGNSIFEIEPDFAERGYLFLLCDGMGGHQAGEVASSLCVNWFWRDYYGAESLTDKVEDWISEEIETLNRKLYDLGIANEEYRGMGTTLAGILMRNGKVYCFNAGDSRCYILQGRKIEQLTEDDSEVWELYRKGKIKKDEIIRNPRKHIITSALGTQPSATYHVYEPFELPERYLILLCSDGVHDVLKDRKIAKLLQGRGELEEKAELLIMKAVEMKSRDDITVVLAEK